jgi:hypothetical protein
MDMLCTGYKVNNKFAIAKLWFVPLTIVKLALKDVDLAACPYFLMICQFIHIFSRAPLVFFSMKKRNWLERTQRRPN